MQCNFNRNCSFFPKSIFIEIFTKIQLELLTFFLQKWRNHREIIPFHSILIDEACVSSSEFVHATKCPGCNDCGGEVSLPESSRFPQTF